MLPKRLQLSKSEVESVWKASRVSDGNEMSFADIRDDRDIGGEIEIDGKRDEFEKRKEIFGFNKRYVKNEDYRLVFWPVNEGDLQFVEV